MRCGKHIMPETSVERFPSSGAARYPPFRATEPQLLRGTHAVTFLPLVFDIATIWLRLRRAGIFVVLRAFVIRACQCVAGYAAALPTRNAGFAPSRGRYFCTRPLSTSAT